VDNNAVFQGRSVAPTRTDIFENWRSQSPQLVSPSPENGSIGGAETKLIGRWSYIWCICVNVSCIKFCKSSAIFSFTRGTSKIGETNFSTTRLDLSLSLFIEISDFASEIKLEYSSNNDTFGKIGRLAVIKYTKLKIYILWNYLMIFEVKNVSH